MKRTIIIAFIIMMLATFALSCTGSGDGARLEILEAYVEGEQALDQEFQEVINAWRQAYPNDNRLTYNMPVFQDFIDTLGVTAEYRLEQPISRGIVGSAEPRIVQLLPGTDIARLAWEGW